MNYGILKSISTGANKETWYVDMKTGTGSVGKGDPPSGKADVTFTSDPETFMDMFAGKIKPTSAFMSGKLKLKGDMSLAMKLEKLMSQMKSKLWMFFGLFVFSSMCL